MSAVYGRAAPVDLDAARLDARHALRCGFDHREAIRRGRDLPLADLLPGHVGNDEQHAVEVQGVAHVDGGDEMADVRRVERASEHAESR